MSIHIMSEVWQKSRMKGSKLLLLLALADYANQDGIAWPSIDSLAQKTRKTRRTVIDLLRELAATGEIIGVGTSERGSLKYKILVGKPEPVQAEVTEDTQNPRNSRAIPAQKPHIEPRTTTIKASTSPNGADAIPKLTADPPGKCEILESEPAHNSSSRGDHMRLLRRVQDCCGISEASTKNAMAKLHQATKHLHNAGVTPKEVDEFGAWWWGRRLGHRANAPPSLTELRNTWGKFMIWRDKRDEDVDWLD